MTTSTVYRVLIVVALVLCGCRGEVVDDPAIEAIARDLVLAMASNDWSAVTGRFHPRIQSQEWNDAIVDLWRRYFYSKHGEFVEIDGVEIRRSRGYAIAYVRCEFKRGNDIIGLTLENGQLVGWRVGEPTFIERFDPYRRLAFFLLALPPIALLGFLALRAVRQTRRSAT